MALRFPRRVKVTAAIGLAAACAALTGTPALASQERQAEWWLTTLHVTQAWQTTTGSGVTVALLDTGVNPAQPDLAGSVISGPDYTNSGEKPGGLFFGVHGTAMASLIVGHGHGRGQRAGIVGVAPGARLLSIRVTLDGTDGLLADSAITSGLPDAIAAGIRYAVGAGAQVIDLPLDPGQSESDLLATPAPVQLPRKPPSPQVIAAQAAAGGSAAEQAAVRYALSKGVVLVAPAGDNAATTDAPDFPAGYPGVISVGAIDSNLTLAPFSTQQPYVTLTAAGSGMTAAYLPGGYAAVSSTAAASAVVTGIAALIKSQYPALTPAQVTQALTSTASRLPGGLTDGSGHGAADAAAALHEAGVIAGPGLHRAGTGAVPRSFPAAPPVQAINTSLAPKLKRDALISAALLAVLLLLIAVYAIARRRRARARAAAQQRPQLAGPGAYALRGDGQTEQMLPYFAAAAGEAGTGRRPLATADAARGPGADVWPADGRRGPGPGYLPGARVPSGPFPENGPLPDDPSRRFGGQLPRSPLAPISRAGAVGPPRVSGSPPWGPAPKPDTELPWAASPPPATGRRMPLSAPAASSLWDAAGPGPGAPGAEAAGANGGSETGAKPIYVWNPGANTDTLPSVRAQDD